MRHTTSTHAAMPGQDSFLDVAANLVGILIILVMVVGAHTKHAFITGQYAAAPPPVPRGNVQEAESAAAAVEANMQELEDKIDRQGLEVSLRQVERKQLQAVVLLAEQELAQNRQAMTAEDRAKYDLAQKLIESKGELQRLGQSLTSITRPSPTVLQHLPTPMARTVFGHEVHFRLLGGKLAYVPMEEMIAAMQQDAPRMVEKLRSQPRVEGSLPVRDGFGARYTLRRDGNQASLEELYLVDAEENLGEPAEQAMQSGAPFRSRLAGLDPKRTTVTIWVYPDSFDQFRRLKTELFKLGFLTAARPLPFGLPIGASPQGNHSNAE